MHLFYTPDIKGSDYELNEEESRHCVKVLRLQANDLVFLIDGRGGFYRARIVHSNPKKTVLSVEEHSTEYGKRNHFLHIAMAPTKNIERFEWFLEKATEIGIDEITPLICERSERREAKTARLNKIITSAVKQSLKAYHPVLNEPVKYKQFINKVEEQKFIAHCMEGDKFSLKQCMIPGGRYTILIGPEGDFTPGELQEAVDCGFRPISLGNSRLRTETAGLEACFEVNFLNR
ncbi:16S rRNA (uracil1498-N3)-methyltransferase [Arcticibacter tournemirensis]|uniref:Ribosomal RNA small subunit methyltransferase E n=1 Tax=Arcticibacter tournemirensis TaxID=699437 RepID=A0A5M9H683_9SPHI|nr:16S rRNA (uracil(1498)-N(3))-methyltransferase [Arcticibacter tournemirensis]KAA8481655.1 16S rRNA (uracil(1498)-N(3))-methyltransferase [Arcticibacter tournemirensis]TQM48947.1 16S rRNA (uracil1498-N3)-methyltransferase [Arcticibacter tournemirensis]